MRRKEKNRWISVEEQLPEDDVLVLVTVSGIYNALTFANAIQIGAYDRDRWFIEGYEDWNNPNVTAWMPLPEIYTSPGAGQAFRLAGAEALLEEYRELYKNVIEKI